MVFCGGCIWYQQSIEVALVNCQFKFIYYYYLKKKKKRKSQFKFKTNEMTTKPHLKPNCQPCLYVVNELEKYQKAKNREREREKEKQK